MLEMVQKLIDIECFPEYFLLGIEDYKTGIKTSFEISEDIDQRKELYKFLKDYSGFWISFNGIHYDNVVLAKGQSNQWFPKLDWKEVCQELKNFSDLVINNQENLQYKEKYYKWKFTNIDLFLYWSKMLRLSKKISLKSLGIQMGYPVVQELPFDPSLILDEQQRAELKHYNLEHDLGILKLLTKKMSGEIELRSTVVNKYGINAWSMDVPKIASEILLQTYCNKTKKDLKSVRDARFERNTIIIKDLLKDFNPDFQTPKLQQIYQEILNSTDSYSSDFVLFNQSDKGVKISFGSGGIHSVNNNEIYKSTETHSVITSDGASLYPNLIVNYKAFRQAEVLDEYIDIKNLRLTQTKPSLAKAKKSGDLIKEKEWRTLDTLYKFLLNSPSGLIDQEYSWLYNPEGALKMRLIGQLILLKLTEKCLIEDFHVISLNTDGIEVIIPNEKLNYYYNTIIPELENQFNLQFEHEKYQKIIYSNVNSYIAILESGKIKKKGQFVTDPEKAVTTPPALGSSVDFLVIPKLLQCYFEKGIRPETIIGQLDTFEYNWDGELEKLHIYDFCASQKVDKSYKVEWKQEYQQRLNRYYVCKTGAYLYKCRDGKKAHMLKGWGVMLYNNHKELSLNDYSIDFKFYLKEVNKIISELEHHNQIELF